ncbi:MAG: Na/Pi symporter [Candidatus Paceibacterota bacterium]
MDITNTIITVLALVIIFIVSIQKFSRHIEEIAGIRLKEILNNWTNTPLKGTVTGGVLSAIIQSGTAATIITVGLVNSQLISFTNALGVTIGINIGTTITSQLVALNMTYIAPTVVILGFLLSHTHSRFTKYGKAVFYFGMMFLSLLIISFLLEPLKSNPSVVYFLQNSQSIYATIIIGALATLFLQSGSVLMGLVILLASGGLLGLNQAIGFLCGAFIGGPLASFIASMHAKTEAKKVAVAQILFNLFALLIFLPILIPFENLLRLTTTNIGQQIVNAQFIMNISTAILCLIFIKPFSKLVTFTTKKLL